MEPGVAPRLAIWLKNLVERIPLLPGGCGVEGRPGRKRGGGFGGWHLQHVAASCLEGSCWYTKGSRIWKKPDRTGRGSWFGLGGSFLEGRALLGAMEHFFRPGEPCQVSQKHRDDETYTWTRLYRSPPATFQSAKAIISETCV